MTINGGFKMPSWYVLNNNAISDEVMMMSSQYGSCRFDIYSLDKAGQQDEEGIQKAASESNLIMCDTKLLKFVHVHVLLVDYC